MLLINFIDLFTLSHGSMRNRNQHWGNVTLMWLAALSSAILVL